MLNKKIVTPRVKIIQNLYSKKSNPDILILNIIKINLKSLSKMSLKEQ